MKVKLEVENHYELYEPETTYPEADIEPPPALVCRVCGTTIDDPVATVCQQGLAHDFGPDEDWLYDNIYPLTGTGRTDGDSSYFVKVLECDDPGLVGQEYEF